MSICWSILDYTATAPFRNAWMMIMTHPMKAASDSLSLKIYRSYFESSYPSSLLFVTETAVKTTPPKLTAIMIASMHDIFSLTKM